jgi:two-component system, OmpR family, sensor kinase
VSLPDRIPTSGRVALAVMSVLVVGVVALSLVAYLGVSRRLSLDTDLALTREAEAYAAAIGPDASLSAPDLVSVSRAYLQARTGSETDSHPILLVRFASGKVLSNSNLALESAPGNGGLLAASSAERRFSTLRFDGEEYRVAIVPVANHSGQVLAVFEAALSAQPAAQVATQLAWTLVGAGMAIVLLGASLSAFVAQGSLRPLRRAANTARSVTMASLGRRIDYDGPDDDVGRMVGALNGMLARLEISFGEQRHFVADASHELRTPLAVVRGHLELLAGDTLTPAERAETLTIVFSELDRMARLVDDLLALARLDVGTMRATQPVELGTLVSEAAARCRAVCGGRRLETSAGSVWVDGDPDALMQAVLNLVRNAEAHTPEGGTITLSSRKEAGRAVLEVADTGSGIRPADLPRIFDRFYRAQGKRRSDTGGSGLGLAITKRLVELHGGTVSAANRETGGAVFRVELPAIAEPRDLSWPMSTRLAR